MSALAKLLTAPNLLTPGEKPYGDVAVSDERWTYWLFGGSAPVGRLREKIPTYYGSVRNTAEGIFLANVTGTGAKVDQSDSWSCPVDQHPFTFIVHLESTGTQGAGDRIVDCKSVWNSNNGWSAEFQNGTTARLITRGSGFFDVTLEQDMNVPGNTAVLVVVADGTNVSVYQCGELRNSSSNPLWATTVDFWIGSKPASFSSPPSAIVKSMAHAAYDVEDPEQLSLDPYQFLKPVIDAPFLFSAGAPPVGSDIAPLHFHHRHRNRAG